MNILSKIFNSSLSISYGITVNDEAKELKVLIDKLLLLIGKNDEIIILQDITNENIEVSELIKSYGSAVVKLESKLNGDFATFKNNLIHHAKGNYLFQIDADEYPAENLLENIKSYLRKEKKSDCFLIPRINIVDGISDEYIKEMNWNINEEGYINFPDYQPRIIKNNKKIFWKNKVHEVFYGNTRSTELPKDYTYCLIHKKSIVKQKQQNAFYDTIN
jgi:glycosyltransferase involved in cell wall biosynthesis